MRRPAVYLLVLATVLAMLPAAAASAESAQVTEYALAPNDFLPGPIVQGPDGNLWFGNRSGLVGKPVFEQVPADGINQITPSGAVTEFFNAELPQQITSIAVDTGGDLWFTALGEPLWRMTPNGGFSALEISGHASSVTATHEGTLWFTGYRETESHVVIGEIGRIPHGGQVTYFQLPDVNDVPTRILIGPSGDLWLVEELKEGAPRIGRMTALGEFSSYQVPSVSKEGRLSISALAAAPDGNIWFTGGAWKDVHVIGRLAPDGTITIFRLPYEPNRPWDGPGRMIYGPDGRLWFTYGWGRLGRVGPTGRLSIVHVPTGEPEYLTSGREGAIWYTADREGPCLGGGGSCQMRIPEPGTVGRVAPAPLSVSIPRQRPKARGRRVKVRLACEEGDATDVCRGTLRLEARIRSSHAKRGGRRAVTLALRRYTLPTDSRGTVWLRFGPMVSALLSRHHRLPAKLTATLSGVRGASRRVVLVRLGRPSGHRKRSHSSP